MNKPYTFFHGKKRILVLSLYSGIDFFMLSLMKSGMLPAYGIEKILKINMWHSELYKHPDGTPVMEPYVITTKEVYDYKKNHRDERGRKDMEDEVGIINGQYVRTKLIQEIDGRVIRAAIEARYGKDIIIFVIGGPPCQGYSKLNTDNNKYESDKRNNLVFEYLRILKEVTEGGLTIGLMEEVMDFGQGQFKEIYEDYLKEAEKLPFKLLEKPMCSLHYGGYQNRWRRVFQFIPDQLNADPVFPEEDLINVKRAKDFLDIDYFVMGGFDQLMRNSDHFIQTVTRGTPRDFFKNGIRRDPTIDELFLCQGVKKGEIPVPAFVPLDLQKLAIGNGVCVHVGQALAKTILEKVLRMKHIGDGYFIHIDAGSDNPGSEDPTNIIAEPSNQQQSDEQPADKADALTGNETKVQEAIIETWPVADVEPLTEKSEPDIKEGAAVASVVQKEETTNPSLGFSMSGVTLWRGPSLINGEEVVAILTFKSANQKTGNMAQLWILPAGMNPFQAIKTGYDESICGNCSLRPANLGGCYVEVAKAPANVWEAWRNGAYPEWPVKYFNVLSRYAVRYGAYGDPAAIPVHILAELKKYVTNYTAYTHQWRSEAAQELKSLCMASVESAAEQEAAVAMGWRTFRIISKGDELAEDEILCPELTNGVKCEKCQLCKGTSRRAKNIVIYAHGPLKNRFKGPVTDPNEGKTSETRIQLAVHHSNPKASVRIPKIISSAELAEMEFTSLNFDGGWLDFFGEPETNFHCLIYGLPGGGKSSMAVQLSSYIAKNFGKTIYLSGEEGFAMSFQHKFLNNDAITPGLDVADIRNYEELVQTVPLNTYKFIFIDSLNTMGIDAVTLRKIRYRYLGAAVITICQSTKEGRLRGSQELAHDSDIIVQVEQGVATTIKNRFKETAMVYQVFTKK